MEYDVSKSEKAEEHWKSIVGESVEHPPSLDYVKNLLNNAGLSDEEIALAEREDKLTLLVIEHLMVGKSKAMTEEELLQKTGLDQDLARRFWRALGFPEVSPYDYVFTDFDVEVINAMRSLIGLGVADEDRAIQIARVIGSSVARIAEAEVTMSQALMTEDLGTESAVLLAVAFEALLPKLAMVLEYAWRRHLQAAARRAWSNRQQNDEFGPVDLAVGFADMVGFTYLAQQLDEVQLAEIVTRFETVAHDTIVSGGGRIVKMIGDEAMFVIENIGDAASIALNLAAAYADDDLLSDVRVGMAFGPVLAWDGDYFGSIVNKASRIVNLANPGSVLVSGEFYSALHEDDRFVFRPLRPRVLKDIGRTELWSMAYAGSDSDDANRRMGVRWRKITEVLRDLDELREHGQRLVIGSLQPDSDNSPRGQV